MFGTPDFLGGSIRTGMLPDSPQIETRRYEFYKAAIDAANLYNLKVLWLKGLKLQLVNEFIQTQLASGRYALLHSVFYEFTSPYSLNASAPWLHLLVDYQPLKDVHVPDQLETDFIQ